MRRGEAFLLFIFGSGFSAAVSMMLGPYSLWAYLPGLIGCPLGALAIWDSARTRQLGSQDALEIYIAEVARLRELNRALSEANVGLRRGRNR